MRSCDCPKCEADISESYQSEDWSVGAGAGWYCDACDLAVGDDGHYEPMEGDVAIMPAPRPTDGRYGIPISELSGQPGPRDDIGHPKHTHYEKFKRLAKSWGYD